MTLPIERSRSRRPVTWLTLIGVLLLPVLIGATLVTALYNPTARLDNMNAAIVNNDKAVTVDGQTVPLGRQLTAGLVKGSDDAQSNLDWTISNTKDAAKGLKDGTYQAVVTIPERFSAAAVSAGQQLAGTDEAARQATIHVATAPDARVIDDAITAQLSAAATSALGRKLSSTTMQNVFVSFTTLGDKLGTAADGATKLADGAKGAATGAAGLADGTGQLATGAAQLATGAGGLATGADGISDGVSQLSGGASQLSDGASQFSRGAAQWASGARGAADGLKTWSDGATSLAGNTRQLSQSLSTIADGLSQAPQIPQQLVDAAHNLAASSDQVKQQVGGAVDRLDALVASCTDQGGSAQLCGALEQAASTARGALPQVNAAIDQSGAIAQGVDGLAKLPHVAAGLQQISGGMTQVAGGMDGLASGAKDAAGGVSKLAAGADGLASGADGLASGADGLASGAAKASSGAATWASGARTWASGTQTWADGAGQSADGATKLAAGITTLADGTDGLADGLHTASASLPSFTDQQAKSLAKVVADPVTASGAGDTMFGASAIPLLAILALWFGGLGSFVALEAVTRRALTSRRPSALLALRALAPAAVIGAVQGLLVAGIVQIAASYSWGTWASFAAVCVVAGVAFAAVNQALVAVFRGAGRWLAALVGVVAVATGVVSTVPGALVAIAGVLPTSPALTAGLSALTGTSGLGAGIAGLVVWALVSFGATVVVVMRRRTTSVAALGRELTLAA